MRKNQWILIAILAIILIGGFVYFNQTGKNSNKLTKTGSTVTKQDLFTSIKDAMSKSLSLKCEYQGAEGKTTTYIKGNMIRMVYDSTEEKAKPGTAIIKDNKMWAWTEGEKEGMLFTINEQDVESEQTEKGKIMEELEKYKSKCSPAVVADSMFTPPSDVVFKDLSKLQEEMMKEFNITGVPSVSTQEVSEE